MKKLSFLLVIALIASPLLAQDLPEQKTEFEKIKADLLQLEKENENLVKQNTDLARELLILKETMRGLLDEAPQKAPNEATNGSFTTPKSQINGSVLVTNKATNKVVIRPGSNGGIEAGYRFQILRDGRQTAVIEIEKVVERYAIGKVIFGEMDNIKADDEAISVMPKSTITIDVKAEKPVTEAKVDSAPNPLAKIKGDLGNGRYVLSVGRADGLKEKDILMVSGSNKSGKATIIIEKVDDDFAVAKLLDGDSIEINDRVEIKQPSINNGLEGLVRIKNEKLIAIDIGTRKGAQVGQRFKITRDGKSVTEVILKELYDDWALVEPIDETKSNEIVVGDKVVELKSSSPQ